MALFGRKKQEPHGGVPPAPPPSTPHPASSPPPDLVGQTPAGASGGWSDINAVRAEWPQASLNEATDLASWQEGVRLYDNDDYASMMRCASLLSPALAHSLYGEGVLRGSDLPETIHKIFYASLTSPPDGRTFADSAQKAARLALTITRENGWQPARMGGQGLFDPMVTDKGNYMLLCAAIAPAGQPWLGDLEAFFAVPPTPLAAAKVTTQGDEVVNRMYDTLQQANAGDQMSEAHMRGMGLWANGQVDEALEALSEAARLGSPHAMKDAGDLAQELGRDSEARFWFESAANAGNSGAMFNMGVFAFNAGDMPTAASWYQRSAEAGNPDGFAALTQIADNTGDAAGERHWARLGAEAGHPFCMFRHGLYLLMDSPEGDVPAARRAVVFLDASAETGNMDAMLLAVNVHHQLGQLNESRQWAARARETGYPQAIEMLDKYGY